MDWDAAEASKRTAETNRLMAEAVATGTARDLALRDARTVALTLTRSSGSWTREAARQALTGSDEDTLEFARTGIAFAAAQDDRATVVTLTLDENPKLAAAATTALDGSDADVVAFLRTQDYPGRDTEERLTVNQLLATARTQANPVTQQRAQTALDSTDPKALRTFIETGQYAAVEVDERVKINQILADSGSTPEVKVMAQIALDAPGAAVHTFLTVGRYSASQHDDDAARHDLAVSAVLLQGYMVSSLATQNAALAQQAAALARKAQAAADKAKKDAAAAADKAKDYAASAKASADKADAAADRAAASASTAAKASKSANAAASQAAGSARRADASASLASDNAQEAYGAYQKAKASAVAAGKDANAAIAAATAAFDDVIARRIKKRAQGQAARDIYDQLEQCQVPGVDPDECAQQIYEATTRPARTAFKNFNTVCTTLFEPGSVQIQNCLNDVLSQTFQLNQVLVAVTPLVAELDVMMAAGAGMTILALAVFVAPAIIGFCGATCSGIVQGLGFYNSGGLIGLMLSLPPEASAAGAAGASVSYGVIKFRGLLEKIGVTAVASSAEAARLSKVFADCLTVKSFPPGTPVLLADGQSKPIADIRVGDQVLSTDPGNGDTESEPVTALHTVPG
jgi:hypothetical protein